LEAANDEEDWVGGAATAAVGKYEGAADARFKVLIQQFAKSDVADYTNARSALVEGAAELFPLLKKLAMDDQQDGVQRTVGLLGLEAIYGNQESYTEQRREEVLDLAERILADAGQPVTLRAAAALVVEGTRRRSRQQTAALLAGLTRAKFPLVRRRCAYLLADNKEKAAIPGLIEAAEDANADVASEAIGALGEFSEDAAAAVPAIVRLATTKADTDKARFAAAEAIRSLAKIGPAASSAVPALAELHASGHKYLRRACATAIWKIDPAAAKEAGVDEPFED